MKTLTEEKKLQVKQLKEWINEQPLFPKNVEEILVVRFLHSNYYDMSKAKTTAELFFTYRALLPEIFTNRDLMNPSVQKCMKYIKYVTYQTPKKRSIWFWQLNDPGLVNYDYVEDMKLNFLVTDAWLIGNENLSEEDFFIMDVKDVNLKLLWKLKLGLMKNCVKYLEGAMPNRLKGIHMINAPSVLDRVMGLFRHFIRKEYQESIHFHKANSTTLYDYFSKDELPADYGGTRPPLEELMKDVVESIERNRKRLSQDMLWSLLKNEENEDATSSSYRLRSTSSSCH